MENWFRVAFCFNFILIFYVLTSCQNWNLNRKLMAWGFSIPLQISHWKKCNKKNFKILSLWTISLLELHLHFRLWEATLSHSHSQSPIMRRPSKAINFRMTKRAPKPLRPPATSSLATCSLPQNFFFGTFATLPRLASFPQCLAACF